MIERLTHRWRRETAEQKAAVAAGTLSPDEAYTATLFPPASVAAVDGALGAYERELASLDPPIGAPLKRRGVGEWRDR